MHTQAYSVAASDECGKDVRYLMDGSVHPSDTRIMAAAEVSK